MAQKAESRAAAQLRMRFEVSTQLMDTFPEIFEGLNAISDGLRSVSFYVRESDVLAIARRGDDDDVEVLFASADNWVDCLFALENGIGQGTWKKDTIKTRKPK